LLLSKARFVVYDPRGTGSSDPVTDIPPLEERVSDLLAVRDDAGIDRAVIGAASESGPVAIQFAAIHPERVQSLVLVQLAARVRRDLPDFPWGFSEAEGQAELDAIDSHWGEGAGH
jgi:pimeloyl-ACP methyl ester carboxylesterase